MKELDNLITSVQCEADVHITERCEAILNKYIKGFPNEIDSLCLLVKQLKQSEDITSRKNFVGHITASGFVINKDTRQVLLHVALREIEEETGLTKECLVIHPKVSGSDDIPFDIDVHYIPENKKKDEPGHYHHDFRYSHVTIRKSS